MNQIDTIPLSDNAPVKMATVMTFADGITWRTQTVNLTHDGSTCNKSDAAALNQLENRSQIGSDAHKPRVPEPIPAERGDGAPEEPAMTAWEWICATVVVSNAVSRHGVHSTDHSLLSLPFREFACGTNFNKEHGHDRPFLSLAVIIRL